MGAQPEIPKSFNESMADLNIRYQDICLALARPLLESALTMAEAVVAITELGNMSSSVDDGVIDAPGVEYRAGGKSFDEYGCELEPTLPFERLR